MKIVKEVIPPSEKEFKASVYKKKGIASIICSALTIFTLSDIILNFEFSYFLAVVLSLTIGIITAIFELKHSEYYYTEILIKYAKYKEASDASN